MEKRVIALGFFDGVHLGHGALLETARQRAAERGCTASVMTFDRHPSEIITGQQTPLITSQEDRTYWFREKYGIEEVLFLHFDRAVMEMPWQEFVESCLLGDLNVCHVVCGWDFRFGYRGEGTAALLKDFCASRGLGCDVIPALSVGGVTVHSTLIRAMLLRGELEEAAAFLGHPYCLSGRVISGKRLGHTIGVPTANIRIPHGVLGLPCGVYATEVAFPGGSRLAVTNVGDCPTVTPGAPVVVEPWLLDFSGDLYGQEIRIFFYKKLRDERKFASLDELRAEILRNAEETRQFFEN